jgi:hypothetical protein
MAEISEWLNVCIGCGHQRVTHGDELPGECAKCHGWRWLCHWVNKPGVTTKSTEKESAGVTAPGQGITPPKELLPLKQNGNSPPGPKIPPVSDDLIKELAGQGLRSKAIASKLAEQGIVVSAMTIHRRLQEGLL